MDGLALLLVVRRDNDSDCPGENRLGLADDEPDVMGKFLLTGL